MEFLLLKKYFAGEKWHKKYFALRDFLIGPLPHLHISNMAAILNQIDAKDLSSTSIWNFLWV